jgi:hypothetical protein
MYLEQEKFPISKTESADEVTKRINFQSEMDSANYFSASGIVWYMNTLKKYIKSKKTLNI